jgi:cell division cycle 2-like
MASKVSRWATTSDDVAAAERRKLEKQEKKRLKQERAQKAAEAAHRASQQALEEEPPSKRQRISSSPAADPESHLVVLPQSAILPSDTVSRYQLLNAIEEGTYGKVSRAQNKITGEVVALKKLKIEQSNNEGFPITGLREIQTLNACSHTHIVELKEVVVGPNPTE